MTRSCVNRLLRIRFLSSSLWFILWVAPLFLWAEQKTGPERWEADIRAFEEKDRLQPPPKDAVLFVGSSSIRMWILGESFPRIKTINRGFGGSLIEDSVYYFDRLVLPYRPKLIVFYAGDNDIPAGKTPRKLLEDFKTFVKKVHTALPKTTILFISIKPSIQRWAFVEKMRQANRLIRRAIQSDKRMRYVDIGTPMIGEDGKPRKELFLEDGLHLNKEGYRLWTSILEPYLKTYQTDDSEKPK